MAREFGKETPWNGWVQLNPYDDTIVITVGERGEGHDEPPRYLSADLTLAEATQFAKEILSHTLDSSPSI